LKANYHISGLNTVCKLDVRPEFFVNELYPNGPYWLALCPINGRENELMAYAMFLISCVTEKDTTRRYLYDKIHLPRDISLNLMRGGKAITKYMRWPRTV
jgi:hypothetical protein